MEAGDLVGANADSLRMDTFDSRSASQTGAVVFNYLIPEPTTMILLALGALTLATRRRRR